MTDGNNNHKARMSVVKGHEESFPLSPPHCHHNKRTSINDTNKNIVILKKFFKKAKRGKFYTNRSQKKAEVLYFYHTK